MRVWLANNNIECPAKGRVPSKLADQYAQAHTTKLYQVDNFNGGGTTQYCMLMTHPSLNQEYLEWVHPDIGKQASADLAQCAAWRDKQGNAIPLEDYLNCVMS